MLTTVNAEDLIARAIAGCAAGDRRSLRVIYDREASAMIGVATRILRRRELAEEAVHDAFTRIWRYAGSFDPQRGDARTWIYAILRHRAISILRSEGRIELLDESAMPDRVAEEESPEAVVSRLSDANSLKRCLEALDPMRRNAILLAYVNGLTHAEIAGKLGVPLGTAKAWIRRTLLALRECLA
jgi:RNA polymerase sigma factor (sigma-70 family)